MTSALREFPATLLNKSLVGRERVLGLHDNGEVRLLAAEGNIEEASSIDTKYVLRCFDDSRRLGARNERLEFSTGLS